MFLLVLAIALAVVQPGLQNPWLLKPENFMFGSKYASPWPELAEYIITV